MVILFHGDYPWHIVKGNGSKAKVCVVRDLLDFLDKTVEIMGLNTVDGSDEIRRR
jgi:hypothetical protein